jgi:peptidoglycan hydrolase CwlO-like protein
MKLHYDALTDHLSERLLDDVSRLVHGSDHRVHESRLTYLIDENSKLTKELNSVRDELKDTKTQLDETEGEMVYYKDCYERTLKDLDRTEKDMNYWRDKS